MRFKAPWWSSRVTCGLVDPVDYTLPQLVGARLHREGHPGLVSTSVRCAGDIHAAFNPRVLSQPKQSCCLTYTLTSTGADIEREPGVVWLTIPLGDFAH